MSTTITDKTDFQQKADQLFDEFQRIKCCPGVTDEIIGLCERAMKGIRSNIPLIDQREKLSERVTEMQRELTDLRARLAEAQAQSEQYRLETHRWADAAKKDREERDGLWKKICDAQARVEKAEAALKQSKELHDFFFERSRSLEASLDLARKDIQIRQARAERAEDIAARAVAMQMHAEKGSPSWPECLDEARKVVSANLTPAPQGRTDRERLDCRLPDSQGDWWWQSDGESAPVVIHIAKDSAGRFFATIGQYGWTEPQFVEDMGGLWVRCREPQMVPFHEFEEAMDATSNAKEGGEG